MHCFILVIFKTLILFYLNQNSNVNGVPEYSPAAFKAIAIERNWIINGNCQGYYISCTSEPTDTEYNYCIDNFPEECLLPPQTTTAKGAMTLTTSGQLSPTTSTFSEQTKGETNYYSSSTIKSFDEYGKFTSTVLPTTISSNLKTTKITELIPQSSSATTLSSDSKGSSSSQISTIVLENPTSLAEMVTSTYLSAKNSKKTPMDTPQSETVSPNLMIKTTEEAGSTQSKSVYLSSLKTNTIMNPTINSETAKMATVTASGGSTLTDKMSSTSGSQDNRVSTKSLPLTTEYPEHDTSVKSKQTTLPLDLTTTQPFSSSSTHQSTMNLETVDDAAKGETSTKALSSRNSPTRLSTSESTSSHLSTELVPRTSQPAMTSVEVSQNEKTSVAAEKSSSAGSSHSHSLSTELPIDHEKVSSSQVNSFTTTQDATSLLPSTSMKTSFSVSTVDEDTFTTTAKPMVDETTMAEITEAITTLTSQSGSTITDSQSQTLSSLAQSPSSIKVATLSTGSTLDVEEATSKANTMSQPTMAETSENSIKINEFATTLMVTSGEPMQTTSDEFSSSQSTIVSSSLKPVESSANSPTITLDEIKNTGTTSSSSPISLKDTTTSMNSWTTDGMKVTTLLPHIGTTHDKLISSSTARSSPEEVVATSKKHSSSVVVETFETHSQQEIPSVTTTVAELTLSTNAPTKEIMKSSLEPSSSLASTGATPSSTGEGGESSPQSSSATSVENHASSMTSFNPKSSQGTSLGISVKNSVSDERTSQSPVTDTASKNPFDSTFSTTTYLQDEKITSQKSVETLTSDSTQEASTLFLSVEPLPSSEKLISTTQIGYTDYENPKTESNGFKTNAAGQNQHSVTFSSMEQSSLVPMTTDVKSSLNNKDTPFSPSFSHITLESSIDSSSSIFTKRISHEPLSSTSLQGKASTFNDKLVSSSVSTDEILESSTPTSTIADKQSSKNMEYDDLNGFSLSSETEEFQDNAMISTEKYESSPKQEVTKIASTEDMPTSSQSLSNSNTGASTLPITNSNDNGIISASSRSIIDIKSSENPSTSFGETSMASLDISTVTTSAPKVSISSTSEASAPSDVEDIPSTSTVLVSSKSASSSHITDKTTSMPHLTGTQSITTTGSFLSTGINGFSSTPQPFESTSSTKEKQISTIITGTSKLLTDTSKQSGASSSFEVNKITTPGNVDSTVLSSTGSPQITREGEDLKLSTATIFLSKSSNSRVATNDITAAPTAVTATITTTGGYDAKLTETKNGKIVTASIEPQPTHSENDGLTENTIAAPRKMSSSSVETDAAPVAETTVDAAQITESKVEVQQSSSSAGVSKINNNGQIATSSNQMSTVHQNVEKSTSETSVPKSSTIAIKDIEIPNSVNTIGASPTVVDEISSSTMNAKKDASTMQNSGTPALQYSSHAPSSNAQVNIVNDASTSKLIKDEDTTKPIHTYTGFSKDLTEKTSLDLNNVSPSSSKVSQLQNTQPTEQISSSTRGMASEMMDVESSTFVENQINQQSTSVDTKEIEHETSQAPNVNQMTQTPSGSQNTKEEEKSTEVPMQESTMAHNMEQQPKTEVAELKSSSSSEFVKLITSSSTINTETSETVTKGSTEGESSSIEDNVQTESVSSQGKTTTDSTPSWVDLQQQQSTKKMDEQKKPPMPSFAFRFMKSRYLSMKYGSYLDNAWILVPVLLAVLVIFKSVIWSDFNLRALHPKIKLMIAIALFGFSFRIGWVIFHYQVMVKYRLYQNWQDYL